MILIEDLCIHAIALYHMDTTIYATPVGWEFTRKPISYMSGPYLSSYKGLYFISLVNS